MKRIVKRANGRDYIIEEFSNFHELIKTNDSRRQNFGSDGGARVRRDNNWCGGTFKQAVEMLAYGWEDKEKVNSISDTVKKLEKTMDSPKMSFKNDIVGYAPIVPLALQGVPHNMINSTRKPKKAKVVNLIIDLSISASVETSEVLDWGARLTAYIMNLEKHGYRVRIDCTKVFARETNGKVHALKFPIKNENQPFDIKRMMFPLAHSAMRRRIAFDWYERLPEAQEISGYGTPIHHWSNYHKDEVVKEIAGDIKNSYFICCMDNIDNVLKGVA